MNKDRPITITLICIFLLLVGSVGLVKSFSYLNDPAVQDAMATVEVPKEAQIGIYYVHLIVLVISGMFMMQEQNWARWVFIGWNILFLIFTFIFTVDPDHLAMRAGIFLGITVLLVLPNANRYFSSKPDYDD